MKEAVSCGGVVIYRGKILLLFKNYHDRFVGWVLPKGSMEDGEDFKETALREVKEETGATGKIMSYIGTSEYEFQVPDDTVNKPCIGILWQETVITVNRKRKNSFPIPGFTNITRRFFF